MDNLQTIREIKHKILENKIKGTRWELNACNKFETNQYKSRVTKSKQKHKLTSSEKVHIISFAKSQGNTKL